jgi:GNAT superfamily N-acetyltransferase
MKSKTMENVLAKIFNKTLGRFFICTKLYKNDLNNFNNNDALTKFENFSFFMPTKTEKPLFEKLYHGIPKKKEIINTQLANPNFSCFAYKDDNTGDIAYARWLCKNDFYSKTMKEYFKFSQNEAWILDDYTHPDYRYKGLHKNMSAYMLQWIKEHTNIRYVYIEIICFYPHLPKVQLQLGYKPVKTVFYYRKGSFSATLKRFVGKLLSKAGIMC